MHYVRRIATFSLMMSSSLLFSEKENMFPTPTPAYEVHAKFTWIMSKPSSGSQKRLRLQKGFLLSGDIVLDTSQKREKWLAMEIGYIKLSDLSNSRKYESLPMNSPPVWCKPVEDALMVECTFLSDNPDPVRFNVKQIKSFIFSIAGCDFVPDVTLKNDLKTISRIFETNSYVNWLIFANKGTRRAAQFIIMARPYECHP